MMNHPAAWLASRSWLAATTAALISVALFLTIVVPLMSKAPLYDELLHILAARGLREVGAPVIADGEYLRALLFTRLVALSTLMFGDSLVAARLPSVLPAALLVGSISVWVSRRHGVLAGVGAGCFLASAPIFVGIAVFVRFYALHALAIGLAAMALYELTERGYNTTRRGVLVAAFAVCVVIAFAVAPEISLIALVAVAAATLLAVGSDNWNAWSTRIRQNRTKAFVSILAVVALLLIALYVARLIGLVEVFRSAPYWATPRVDQFHYYFTKLGSSYSLLWPLWPAAVLVALVADWRLAIYCAGFVMVAMLIHSAAAAKSVRYVAYLWPWICVVLGVALATAILWAGKALSAGKLRKVGILGVLIVTALGLAISDEGRRTIKAVFGNHEDFTTDEKDPSWNAAVPLIRSLARSADVLVVSNSMKALYFLGDYDFEISATILRETITRDEFGIDHRTGRGVISSVESLASVLARSAHVLIVIENKKLGHFTGVTPDVADFIKSRCTLAASVEASELTVWSCVKGAERNVYDER